MRIDRTNLTLLTVSAAAGLALILGAAPSTPGSVDYAATDTVPRIADCSEFADATNVADTVPGVCGLPTTDDRGYPALDTADYGTDIPRCASDDFNADHVTRCYTQRVTDGAVILLDADDTVIATLTA